MFLPYILQKITLKKGAYFPKLY